MKIEDRGGERGKEKKKTKTKKKRFGNKASFLSFLRARVAVVIVVVVASVAHAPQSVVRILRDILFWMLFPLCTEADERRLGK